MIPRAPRRCRLALTAAAIVLGAFWSDADAQRRALDSRLMVGIGVIPQLQQFIEDTAFPAEVYFAEVALPIGTDWRAGGSLTARRDFALVGGALHRRLNRSTSHEWRLTLGLEYVVPTGAVVETFEALKGDAASAVDGLALRFGLGQTFQMERTVALRVAYDARLVKPGSVLSMLESLDDSVGAGETFWIHQFGASLDIRLGGAPR